MKHKTGKQAGFGMMEVLVAMAIMAVGVLGFAALQARALQSSGSSYGRSQATEIAQDFRERIRVNQTLQANYVSAANWSNTFPPAVIATPSTACTGVVNRTLLQMVACDIQDVKYNAQALLPHGMVAIWPCQNESAGNPINCIYVTWNGTIARTPLSGTDKDACVLSTGAYDFDSECIVMGIQ